MASISFPRILAGLGLFLLAGAAAGGEPVVKINGRECPKYISVRPCRGELGLGWVESQSDALTDFSGAMKKWQGSQFDKVERKLFSLEMREFLVEKAVDRYLEIQQLYDPGPSGQRSALGQAQDAVKRHCTTLRSADNKFQPDRFYPIELVNHLEERKLAVAAAAPKVDPAEIGRASQCLSAIDRRIEYLGLYTGPAKIKTLAETRPSRVMGALPWYHLLYDNVLNSADVRAMASAPCGPLRSFEPTVCHDIRTEMEQLASEKELLLLKYSYLGDATPSGRYFYQDINQGADAAPAYGHQLDAYKDTTEAEQKRIGPILTGGGLCMDLAYDPGPRRVENVKANLDDVLLRKSREIEGTLQDLCDPEKEADYARASALNGNVMAAFFKCQGMARTRKDHAGYGNGCEYRQALSAAACGTYFEGQEKEYQRKLSSDALQGAMVTVELATLPMVFAGVGGFTSSLSEAFAAGGFRGLARAAAGQAVRFTVGAGVGIALEGGSRLVIPDGSDGAKVTLNQYQLGFATPEQRDQALGILSRSKLTGEDLAAAALSGGFFALGATGPKIKVTPEMIEDLESYIRTIEANAAKNPGLMTGELKGQIARYRKLAVELAKARNWIAEEAARTVHSEKPSSPWVSRQAQRVENGLAQLRDFIMGSGSREIDLVGEQNVKVTPQNGGAAVSFEFPDNRHGPVAGLDPSVTFESLKPGKKVRDANGARWRVKAIDPHGAIHLEAETGGAVRYLPADPYRQPAHVYRVEVELPGGERHPVEVAIPARPDGKPDLESLARLKKAISLLPVEQAKSLELIRINSYGNVADRYWKKEYKTILPFTSGATAGKDWSTGKRVIDFYPAGMSMGGTGVNATFRHELGHLVATRLWGTPEPSLAWKDAMAADRSHVSGYAKVAPAEDFAETIRVYLASDGGARNPGARASHLERFKILDRVFQADPAKIALLQEEFYRALQKKSIIFAGTSAGAVVIYKGAMVLMDDSNAPAGP